MVCILFPGLDEVLKLVDCMVDVSCKVNEDCAVMVFQGHIDTTLFGSGPIGDDFLFSVKYWQEVVGVFFSFVFYAKVINYKAKIYGETFVCEHTRGVLGLMVAWGGKLIHKTCVGNNFGLGKAIHAL